MSQDSGCYVGSVEETNAGDPKAGAPNNVVLSFKRKALHMQVI